MIQSYLDLNEQLEGAVTGTQRKQLQLGKGYPRGAGTRLLKNHGLGRMEPGNIYSDPLPFCPPYAASIYQWLNPVEVRVQWNLLIESIKVGLLMLREPESDWIMDNFQFNNESYSNLSQQYWAQMESQGMIVPMAEQVKLCTDCLLGPKSIRKSTVSRQNDSN